MWDDILANMWQVILQKYFVIRKCGVPHCSSEVTVSIHVCPDSFNTSWLIESLFNIHVMRDISDISTTVQCFQCGCCYEEATNSKTRMFNTQVLSTTQEIQSVQFQGGHPGAAWSRWSLILNLTQCELLQEGECRDMSEGNACEVDSAEFDRIVENVRNLYEKRRNLLHGGTPEYKTSKDCGHATCLHRVHSPRLCESLRMWTPPLWSLLCFGLQSLLHTCRSQIILQERWLNLP